MPNLPTRQLGRTGLQVTMMGYGAMELRGAPRGRDITHEQAEAVLNAVLDSGINFIDTSIDYGQSEELIGRYISRRRSEFYLASKCGCPVGVALPPPDQPLPPHIFSRQNIFAGVEQSLARLKTDYLDLVLLHTSPSKELIERENVIQSLLDLKQQGKARFIGSSSTLPHLRDHIDMGVFDVFQIPYSALQPEHEEVITQAAQAGAGIVVRGGAARGAVSEERQHGYYWELWQRAGLSDLLGDMTPMEFVLRSTFAHPDLHTNIVGTINLDHLRDNLAAVRKGSLPQDLYTEAKRRLQVAIAAAARARRRPLPGRIIRRIARMIPRG